MIRIEQGLKISAKSVLCIAVIFITVLSLIVFRSSPVSRIWNEYRVFYVENSVPEEKVLTCLAEAGCSDVISRSVQDIPVSSPFLMAARDSSGASTYISDRMGYFTDREAKFNLFYIPDSCAKNAETALKRLVKETHVHAGLDRQRTYPFLIPVVTAAVFGLLTLVSPKRPFFAGPAVFPIMLSFSVPNYGVACGVCLFLFALYLPQKIWDRGGALSVVICNIYIDVLLCASFVIFFAVSVRCGLLSVLVLASSAAVILLLREYSKLLHERYSFSFSLIFKARHIQIMTQKNVHYLLCLTVPILLFLFLFLLDAPFSTEPASDAVAIPAPSEHGSDSTALPTIGDFNEWAWETVTFPYRNLNAQSAGDAGTVKDGDKIRIKRYANTEKGIKTSEETVLVYDAAFRHAIEKQIMALDYPAVEKFLAVQDRNVIVSYNGGISAKDSGDIIVLLVILLALCVPLVLNAVYNSFGRIRT